ncbi:hypothetical protein [Clostridium sp.]|uniref:hypothetical protein n=1 Tax=Clostridium sp. TaxID=1506 RepID=UPI003217BF21
MENDKKRKIDIKIEKDENGNLKDLEIQDPSLDINSKEERPGIGIEIFGLSGSNP